MNIIYRWGDWKKDEKRGISQQSAEWNKSQFVKALRERWDEDQLESLWDLVEISCEYKPSITALNKLMPGRKTLGRIPSGYKYEPRRFELGDEFTTLTARHLSKSLQDFYEILQADQVRDEYLGQEGEQAFKIRSSVFWDKLSKAMKDIPASLKNRLFYHERCGNCGKRVAGEREKNELYCRLCGHYLDGPGGTVHEAGEGPSVGKKLPLVLKI